MKHLKYLALLVLLYSGGSFAADSYIQMPSDAANTGKKSATVSKTDGADTVHVGRSTIEDATTTNQAAVSAAGALKVDGSAVTQPVSGTFWPTTQPVSGAATPADAYANPSTALPSLSFLMGWNGATWDRLISEGVGNDGEATHNTGVMPTESYAMLFNGSTWDRQRGDLTSGAWVNIKNATMPTTPVTGTFWQSTQPVSIATAPVLVAGSALIGGTNLVDTAGTTKATVKAASTAAASGDTSLTVQLSPSQPNLTTALNVAGTVAQGATGSNAASWWTRIGDATNGPAKVQAASATPAAADLALTVVASPNGSNPCQNPSATLLSVAGATSGTSSVQLVALSGTKKIYVCSATVVGVSGTTPTFSLTTGTGTACATGTSSIIPAYSTAAGTLYQFATPVGVTAAGGALCYVDTGTTPVQNYSITYVQQ